MPGDEHDDFRIGGAKGPRASEPAFESSDIAGTQSVGGLEDAAIAETTAIASTTEAAGPGATERICAALADGSIDSAQAQALLIDEVVRSTLPPDSPAVLVEQVRTEVAALLANDPALGDLLRR